MLDRRRATNITADSVAKKLSKLKPNKASGPLDSRVKLIQTFAKYFVGPLSYIFNESFTCETLPGIWKISRVCGVPKSKPCTTVDLLRLISLTSALSKVYKNHTITTGVMRMFTTNLAAVNLSVCLDHRQCMH